MKVKLISGVLLILLVAAAYWGLNASKQVNSNGANKPSNNVGEIAPKESEAPIIDDQEGFQVSVKWKKQEGASIQKFAVNLGNHAVNVDDFDFKKNIQVQINNKKIPITVEVLKKSGSGHHLGAELQVTSPEFTKVPAGSQMILRIMNVYDTSTRNFTWMF